MPELRRARAEDAAEVRALLEEAYRGAASRESWTSEADLVEGDRTSVALVTELIADPAVRVMLLEGDDGAPLACFELADRGDGVAYFGSFAVRPTRSGGGTGRRLIADAERIAREELGARRLRMTVIEQRGPLIAWYERLGFVRTGEREPFPILEPPLSQPLIPGLHFAVLEKPL